MERIYRFKNSSIKIIFGDIVNSEADIIVSSLSMGGGVSPMIRAKLNQYIFSEMLITLAMANLAMPKMAKLLDT